MTTRALQVMVRANDPWIVWDQETASIIAIITCFI